jgi:hypothetical protein
MIRTDESALICDLAETYHIYNYRSLPLKMVATFSVGLRENSRIKMAMAGTKYTFDTLLLASILDNLNIRAWAMSENGQKGIDRPTSIVSKLLGKEEVSESEYMLFDTAEAFEEMWNRN